MLLWLPVEIFVFSAVNFVQLWNHQTYLEASFEESEYVMIFGVHKEYIILVNQHVSLLSLGISVPDNEHYFCLQN
jgi:hypothetical protein